MEALGHKNAKILLAEAEAMRIRMIGEAEVGESILSVCVLQTDNTPLFSINSRSELS